VMVVQRTVHKTVGVLEMDALVFTNTSVVT